jgi:hypothetical protein
MMWWMAQVAEWQQSGAKLVMPDARGKTAVGAVGGILFWARRGSRARAHQRRLIAELPGAVAEHLTGGGWISGHFLDHSR